MDKNNDLIEHIEKNTLINNKTYFNSLFDEQCQKTYNKKLPKKRTYIPKNNKSITHKINSNNIDIVYFRNKYFEILEREEYKKYILGK